MCFILPIIYINKKKKIINNFFFFQKNKNELINIINNEEA